VCCVFSVCLLCREVRESFNAFDFKTHFKLIYDIISAFVGV
jgi:hypothetical protein